VGLCRGYTRYDEEEERARLRGGGDVCVRGTEYIVSYASRVTSHNEEY